jgi:hypothetical protein
MTTTLRPNAAALLEAIAAGSTVYIVNTMRAWKIDAKAVARFARAGLPIIKDGKRGELLMASGRAYVDCSYCRIEIR